MGINRDDPLGGGEPVKESRQIAVRQPCHRKVTGARGGQCRVKSADMMRDIIVIHHPPVGQFDQQRIEQGRVAARSNSQMQIRNIAGRGAARVYHHHFRAARFFRRDQPLIEHRMAPSQIAADQHHQICLIKILIGAGHGIRPKGALVPRNRRRHAEPGIGVHISGADIALNQFVGGIIILGQHLA